MKELVQALNRLAAAQEESNRISTVNTELLQRMLSAQEALRQNAKLPFSNPTIKDRPIMQEMTQLG